MSLQIPWVVEVYCIMFWDGLEDKTIRVAFKAVCVYAALAVVRDIVSSCDFNEEIAWRGQQVGSRNAEEVVRGQRRVV